MYKKTIDNNISKVKQECIACLHKGPIFTRGKLQRNESRFNTDVLIRSKRVTNDRYCTHLFLMECLNTSFTTARYVNRKKYTSKYDMVNKVATDCWIYGEYGDGFGKPLMTFTA